MSCPWRTVLKTTWWNKHLAFRWSPQPWILVSKVPCLIHWHPQHKHRKGKNHPYDVSLVYLFSPRLAEQPSFLTCCLCVGFVERFLGIFTLIIQSWNPRLSQLLNPMEKQVVCYLVKEDPLQCLVETMQKLELCCTLRREKILSFTFFLCVHLRGWISRGMYSYLDQLIIQIFTVIVISKTTMGSKISSLLFSW